MRAYSSDLRERIVNALERGMSRREVVTTFGISLGTIKRLVAGRRAAQDLTPQSPPGRPPHYRRPPCRVVGTVGSVA